MPPLDINQGLVRSVQVALRTFRDFFGATPRPTAEATGRELGQTLWPLVREHGGHVLNTIRLGLVTPDSIIPGSRVQDAQGLYLRETDATEAHLILPDRFNDHGGFSALSLAKFGARPPRLQVHRLSPDGSSLVTHPFYLNWHLRFAQDLVFSFETTQAVAWREISSHQEARLIAMGQGTFAVFDQTDANLATRAAYFGYEYVLGQMVEAPPPHSSRTLAMFLHHPRGESVRNHPLLNLPISLLDFGSAEVNERIAAQCRKGNLVYLGDLVSLRTIDFLSMKAMNDLKPTDFGAVNRTLAGRGLHLDMNTAGWERPS